MKNMQMSVQDTDRLRSYQEFLRGKPLPEETIKGSMAQVEHELTRQFLERQKISEQTNTHLEGVLGPLHDLLSKGKGFASGVQGLRETAERLSTMQMGFRDGSTLIPRINPAVSPNDITLGPPYLTWTWTMSGSPGTQNVSADANAGTFYIGVSGGGGSAAAAAGLAVQFNPVVDNPTCLFTPEFYFQGSWLDSSTVYTAHNDCFIGMLIQAFDLNGNHLGTVFNQTTPIWSDGTSGFEPPHSGNPSGVNLNQRASFSASSSQIYLLWFWAQCSCDDHSANLLGSSFAQATLNVTLSGAVVGSS